jgi:hypothetical protein
VHCSGIDSELFGNDAHTGPPRSRQGLTDPFSSVEAIGGRPRRLPSLLARASPARTRSAIIARSNSAIRPSSDAGRCGGIEALLVQKQIHFDGV